MPNLVRDWAHRQACREGYRMYAASMGFPVSRKAGFLRLAVLGLLFLGLVACASPPAGGTFESSDRYETVFRACASAATDLGFGVTSADSQSGFISASQAVLAGQGTSVVLSIDVHHDGGRVAVDADFVRPPGTLSLGGDFGAMFDKYVAAVRRRVPDVTITFRKS